MEWVETTGKTVEMAREAALDQLGVAADEAEFEVIEEPRPGLFGRIRGEARLRARVRPAQVRPKQERRRRGRSDKATATSTTESPAADEQRDDESVTETESTDSKVSDDSTRSKTKNGSGDRSRRPAKPQPKEKQMSNDERPESTVTPDEVGAAAVTFMEGLTEAFGSDAAATLTVDDLALEVTVTGAELGLLVGPGGRTLNAIQDLARVSAQRRLGDHDTRLRIDVGGYRERREAALVEFVNEVAEQVRSTDSARSLEPMTSSDRKVVHDALNEQDGVTSRSVGQDPNRRIVVEPT